MNQILKLVVTFSICLLVTQVYSQKTQKTTEKGEFPYTKEVFYVLKDDPTIKHGTYTKSLSGKAVCSGTYTIGERTGDWQFYNAKGNIEQIVNFDTFTLTKNNSEKNLSPEPVLLGGFPMLYHFIGGTMKYPKDARRRGTQGKVYVKFTITELGIPTNFEVTEGIGNGCDEEALSVFQTIGLEYFPALNEQGEPVSMEMILPVIFKLADY